jgi:hypothetical protein
VYGGSRPFFRPVDRRTGGNYGVGTVK